METLLPYFAFGIKYRAEHRRCEMPQVEDLDGRRGCHASPPGVRRLQPLPESGAGSNQARLQQERKANCAFWSL
jgi:hypothetical protein